MTLEQGKTYSFVELVGLEKGDPIYSAVEREVREQIAREIEELRVQTCRCGTQLKPWCNALLQAWAIANGEKNE